MTNLAHHPFHGTDPAKSGVQAEPAAFQNEEDLRPGEILQRKFDLKGTLKPDTDKEMEPYVEKLTLNCTLSNSQ
jgi:hypothetical protein